MVITVTCPSCSTSFPVDPKKIPEGGVNARCSSCREVFRVEKPSEAEPLPTLDDLGPTPTIVPTPEPPPLPEPEPQVAEPEPEPAPAAADDWVVETEEAPQVEPEPLPSLTDEAPSFVEAPVAEADLAVDASESEPPATTEPTTRSSDPFAEAAPFEREAPESEPAPQPAAVEPAAEPEAASAPAAVQGFTFGKRDPTDKAKRLARVLVSDMIMYNAERHQSALASGTLVQDFEEEIDKSWKEYVDQVGDEMANGVGRQFWTDALNDILAKGKQVF